MQTSRRFFHPATVFNPANGGSASWIDEALIIVGQVGRPVGHADVGEFGRLPVRAAERLEEGVVATPSQFVLDSFGDEPAAIPRKTINPLNEVARKRDGDALTISHARSMAQSMIILNRRRRQSNRGPGLAVAGRVTAWEQSGLAHGWLPDTPDGEADGP